MLFMHNSNHEHIFLSHFSPQKSIIDYFKGLLMTHNFDIFMSGKTKRVNVMKLIIKVLESVK